MAFGVGDNAQDLPDLKAGLGSAFGETPRRLPWPSRTDLKRYGRGTREREVEKQRDMDGSELEPNRINQRERRRLQNLHAQRGFRARSKIHQNEVGRCAEVVGTENLQADNTVRPAGCQSLVSPGDTQRGASGTPCRTRRAG